jgi:plasmid stabilization system protein ParE
VSWPVVILPRAETDLREAQFWYDSQRQGLGDELLEEVERAVVVLKDRPESRPVYYKGFRRILTRRFPYKIFYRVEDDLVIVFRILHVRRDHSRQL